MFNNIMLNEWWQPPETLSCDLYHTMAPLPHSDTALFLPHILTLASTLGVLAPHTLFLYSNPPPPPNSDWPRLFSSQNFSCVNIPTISSQLFFLLTPLTKMEQTQCSETSAYKIQTPGNYPRERIQQSTFTLVKRVLCAKLVAEVANRWTSCCLAVAGPQVKHNNSCSRGICQSCSLSGSCCRKLLQHYILSVKMATLLLVRQDCTALASMVISYWI
jgi:hypothetical protein